MLEESFGRVVPVESVLSLRKMYGEMCVFVLSDENLYILVPRFF